MTYSGKLHGMRGAIYFGRDHVGFGSTPHSWVVGEVGVIIDDFLDQNLFRYRAPTELNAKNKGYVLLEAVPMDSIEPPFVAAVFIPDCSEITEVCGARIPKSN